MTPHKFVDQLLLFIMDMKRYIDCKGYLVSASGNETRHVMIVLEVGSEMVLCLCQRDCKTLCVIKHWQRDCGVEYLRLSVCNRSKSSNFSSVSSSSTSSSGIISRTPEHLHRCHQRLHHHRHKSKNIALFQDSIRWGFSWLRWLCFCCRQ